MSVPPAKDNHPQIAYMNVKTTDFGLKKTAFEQHQCLRFELVDKLAQTHTQVLVTLSLLLQDTPGFFIREAFLEPVQNFDICKLSLRKPCLRDYAQALSQHAKELGTVGDDDNRLLDG